MPSIPQLWLKRIVLSVMPALILASIVASTVWGDNGLRARASLRRELVEANEHLAALDKENAQLLRDLSMLEKDPYVLERAVAEEISYGRPGTTIYRFDAPDPFGAAAAPVPVAPPPVAEAAAPASEPEPELPAVPEEP
jgi:cell division protein FtsB